MQCKCFVARALWTYSLTTYGNFWQPRLFSWAWSGNVQDIHHLCTDWWWIPTIVEPATLSNTPSGSVRSDNLQTFSGKSKGPFPITPHACRAVRHSCARARHAFGAARHACSRAPHSSGAARDASGAAPHASGAARDASGATMFAPLVASIAPAIAAAAIFPDARQSRRVI
jgi:hypothetical protein